MKKIILLSLLLSFNGLYAQVNLSQGLVAHYPLNGNTKDSTANQNHGTNDGVTLASDRYNNANSAYFFDGDDHYIDVPSSASIEPKNAVSVSTWVNTTDEDFWNFVICKRLNHGQEPGNSYCISTYEKQGSFYWQWSISSSTTQYYALSNTPVEEDKWLHLVGTFDGDTLNFYLNAQKIGSEVIPHTEISYSALSLRLGLAIKTNSGSKSALKGYLDEVRIYDRRINEDEIEALYTQTNASIKGLDVVKNNLTIYPNPSSDKIFINSINSKYELSQSTISITDMTGKEVLNTTYSVDGVDISGLQSGMYLIYIPSLNSTVKFIK